MNKRERCEVFPVKRSEEQRVFDMESEEERAIVATQGSPLGRTEREDIRQSSEEEVDSEDQSQSEGDEPETESEDVFNINSALTMLESEADLLDDEFEDALAEIEGKKSSSCPSCDKICKSKGGLTRHTNAKHASKAAEASSLTTTLLAESDMTMETLSGIIEAIKTRLVATELYGAEVNESIKNASCSKTLLDDVRPLYSKFCRKKNQDKLLEHFYGLLPNAAKYLSTNSNAATLTMIELPDHLVGHYKLGEERERLKTEPTTATSDIKLDPKETGPLSYVAGYVVSKLFQKSRTARKPDENLQRLLQALKSAGVENSFIQARSRGGLVTPCDHLVGIVEEAEICFRKAVGECDLTLRNIPTESISEATLSSPVVKSLWENIVLESGIDWESSKTTHKLCLEKAMVKAQ